MFFDLVMKFSTARSYQDIHRFTLESCALLNVDHFLYLISVPDSHNKFSNHLLTNLSDGCSGAQAKMQKVRIKDNPFIRRTLESITPVIWSSVAAEQLPLNSNAVFSPCLVNIGLTDGVSVGVNGGNGGKGIMLYAVRDSSIFDRDANAIVCFLHLISTYVYGRIALLPSGRPKIVAKLSTREQECLSWLIQGKTSWEIGTIMGITARTVDFHIANIVTKLDCRNRQQAIATAMLNDSMRQSHSPLFEDAICLCKVKDYAPVQDRLLQRSNREKDQQTLPNPLAEDFSLPARP
jgi:LuxR family transcriptional activator of bioluminescence operon